MKNQLFISLLFILFSQWSVAQQINKANLFDNQYPPTSLCALQSGAWLLSRTGYFVNSGGEYLVHTNLIKLNANGDPIWEKNTPFRGQIASMTEIYDGRILILYQSSGSITLLNSDGTEAWSHYYGGPNQLKSIATYPVHIGNVAAPQDSSFFYIAGNFKGAAKAKVSLTDGALLNIDSTSNQNSYAAVALHPTNPRQIIWMLHNGKFEIYERDVLVYTSAKFFTYPDYSGNQRIIAVPGVPQMVVADLQSSILVFDSVGLIKKYAQDQPAQIILQSKIFGISGYNETKLYHFDDLSTPFETVPPIKLRVNGIANRADQSLLANEVYSGRKDIFDNIVYPYSSTHSWLVSLTEEGIDQSNQADIGVTKISAVPKRTGFVYDINTFNFVYIKTVSVDITLKNYGSVAVDSAILYYVTHHLEENVPSVPPVSTNAMLPTLNMKKLYDLHLQPGAEKKVRLNLPDSVFIDKEIGFCAWTALPQGQTDVDRDNDITCNVDFYDSIPPPSDQFRCFPNPVRDQLFVSLPFRDLYGARFRIWSVTGQAVLDGVVQSDFDYYFINTAPLGAGMYILKVGENTVKFIKE